MNFQIKALERSHFEPLFLLSDAALAQQHILRQRVIEYPGTPCRVSLVDAAVGESVLLLNYQHLPAPSPFQSAHAIFVRESAQTAQLAVNEIPVLLSSRLLSVRVFDHQDMMIAADVVDGIELGDALGDLLQLSAAAFVHVHAARQGCFAARIDPIL